ncbi:MAG: 6-hydroxymethylpterin diphosphokinase MptE-like protein [Treponemataceae bacterium]
MSEVISFARSGEPIVSLDGIYLHSRYNPRLEADRYVDSLHIEERKETLIVLEPGLGYLCASLNKKKPIARILVAHCSLFYKFEGRHSIKYQAADEWFPDGILSFEKFLEQNILDAEAEFVKIVEWKPAIGAYGKDVYLLASIAASFLKRASANARTIAQFGTKWFRNALFNASRISTELRIKVGTCPIAVVASGPSLEANVEKLRSSKKRNSVFIVAVSSSVQALLSGGIRPDLIVATDGGGWALFHLQDAIREQIPLAITFSAALPSSSYASPILTIRDYSQWQEIVGEVADLASFRSPQRGTVAATAIDLALSLTAGKVYLVGFDLGVRLGRTHARPNALDRFQEDTATRVSPSFSAAYERYLVARNGQSLRIYADWMSDHLSALASRIVILGSASNVFDSFSHSQSIEPDSGRKLVQLEYVRRPSANSQSSEQNLLTTLRSRIETEIAFFVQNERERIVLFKEGSATGELFNLFYPSEFSHAVTKYRTREVPLQFVLNLDEKLHIALTSFSLGARKHGSAFTL